MKQLDIALKAMGTKNPAKVKTYVYGGVAFLGALAIAAIVVKIVKSRKDKKAEQYGASDMQSDIESVDVQSRNLTISQGDAVMIAQNLLNAMNKYGTDEQAIYDNLNSLQTKDDLLLVTQKFGAKPYNGAGLSSTFIDKNLFTTMKNLNGWLRAELNSREEKKVKEIYDRLGVNF